MDMKLYFVFTTDSNGKKETYYVYANEDKDEDEVFDIVSGSKFIKENHLTVNDCISHIELINQRAKKQISFKSRLLDPIE